MVIFVLKKRRKEYKLLTYLQHRRGQRTYVCACACACACVFMCAGACVRACARVCTQNALFPWFFGLLTSKVYFDFDFAFLASSLAMTWCWLVPIKWSHHGKKEAKFPAFLLWCQSWSAALGLNGKSAKGEHSTR